MRVVLYLLMAFLFLATSPARADDWTNCKAGGGDARIAACTRMIEKGGQSPRDLASAYRFRAVAYGRQKEKEKADADLKEAMRIDPATAAFSRGFAGLLEGDTDAAISEFSKAIKADPGNADIYNARGVAYLRKGDADRAVVDYSQALKLDPGSAPALSNRGRFYLNRDNPELALADLNEAIRLAPDYPVAYLNRALVFARQDNTDAAMADLNKAIQLDPKSPDPYAERAELHGAKNDYENAIADTSTALELDPEYLKAYSTRARAYGSKGDLDRALSDLNSAIQINPKVAYLYSNRGNVQIAKKSVDRAIVDYTFAIQLESKGPLAYFNRGKAYEQKNNPDRALADYRKVLDLPAISNTDKQRQELVRQRIARLTQANRDEPKQQRTGGSGGQGGGGGAGGYGGGGGGGGSAPYSSESPPSPTPSPAAPPARRVALVIGNAKYASVGELTNPPNDAKGVATSLRRLGFDHVVELYDVSREKMGRALKEFGDWAEKAEWAVVFYAGHGIEMNGVTYLIPTDAELARDSHVADEAISLTQVQAKVDAASKLGLIILDSCRNNPFLARMVRSGSASRAIGRGLAMVEPEGSVLVAYSAKHGTTASDGSGTNSPFSEALLHHIEEPGLEINFLFRKVRDEVRSKTQRQQEPFLYGSLSSERLYFKEMAQQ